MSEREELAEDVLLVARAAMYPGVYDTEDLLPSAGLVRFREWFEPTLRAHVDRAVAEALAPVLALADEWGSLDLADLGTLSRPTTEALVHKMAADLRAAALRAAAGTSTHDTTEEDR